MKRLFTHHDPLLAGYLHATLTSRGIEAVVKNSYLSGALGELPLTATWPEVWVIHDADFAKAEAIMREILPDE